MLLSVWYFYTGWSTYHRRYLWDLCGNWERNKRKAADFWYPRIGEKLNLLLFCTGCNEGTSILSVPNRVCLLLVVFLRRGPEGFPFFFEDIISDVHLMSLGFSCCKPFPNRCGQSLSEAMIMRQQYTCIATLSSWYKQLLVSLTRH